MMKIQQRVKGQVRIPTGTSVLPELRLWVEREARKAGVSKAFVVANCISYASGIAMVQYADHYNRRRLKRLVG